MKKKIIVLLFAFILCFSAVVPVFAAEEESFDDRYYRLYDLADILTDSEETALLEKLDEVSLRQKMDVVILTVNDIEDYDSAADYADYIYDSCNYGYGQNQDGILLLISMENHDWAISTGGYGITAFTDAGLDYIESQIKDDLSDGNYAEAFDTYVTLCDTFIEQARTGTPYDKNNLPRKPLSIIWIPISIGIGIILALIIVGTMKDELKTVRAQAAADNYLKKDSLDVTESSDLFLYHTVERTERKEDSNSSGSSTHTSSSGNTHGGSSGKF